MLTIDFSGQVVIVTGGSKGIGRTICERFLELGADVLTCGRSEPDELPTAGGRTAAFFACDVRDPDQVDALVGEAERRWGRVDVVVNNAGGSPHVDAATASPRFSESLIRLNLVAPLHVAQRANTVMQRQESGGTIINIASVAGKDGKIAYATDLARIGSSLPAEWLPVFARQSKFSSLSPSPDEAVVASIIRNSFEQSAGYAVIRYSRQLEKQAMATFTQRLVITCAVLFAFFTLLLYATLMWLWRRTDREMVAAADALFDPSADATRELRSQVLATNVTAVKGQFDAANRQLESIAPIVPEAAE